MHERSANVARREEHREQSQSWDKCEGIMRGIRGAWLSPAALVAAGGGVVSQQLRGETRGDATRPRKNGWMMGGRQWRR